jgi:hypothetical protein
MRGKSPRIGEILPLHHRSLRRHARFSLKEIEDRIVYETRTYPTTRKIIADSLEVRHAVCYNSGGAVVRRLRFRPQVVAPSPESPSHSPWGFHGARAARHRTAPSLSEWGCFRLAPGEQNRPSLRQMCCAPASSLYSIMG